MTSSNHLTVADLVGQAKTQSDLIVSSHKLRYEAAPTITQNTIVNLYFNMYDDVFWIPGLYSRVLT